MCLVGAIIAWGGAIAWGFFELARYMQTESAAEPVPRVWPIDSRLSPPRLKPSLLVFLHPRCPCSLATVSELERLVAKYYRQLDFTAVLVLPPSVDDSWSNTILARRVRNMPKVTIINDLDSIECKRFAASVSGQILLYDRNGQLLFTGGITPGRGHEGDSLGALVVSDVAAGRVPRVGLSAAYGCRLRSDDPTAPEEVFLTPLPNRTRTSVPSGQPSPGDVHRMTPPPGQTRPGAAANG